MQEPFEAFDPTSLLICLKALKFRVNQYIIKRYLAGGELYFHLRQERLFSEKKAKFYIEEIVIAIEHLHSIDIIYRDLKLENVLLDVKVRFYRLCNVIYTYSSTRILENPLPRVTILFDHGGLKVPFD